MVKKKTSKRVLVIGGAGYIGSHVVKSLVESHYTTAVYDNLSTGKREHVKKGIKIYKASILQPAKLKNAFTEFKPSVIIHLAAEKSVGKSMQDANAFSDTNIIGTINVLKAMHEHKVKHLVFSSSAAVFGTPEYVPIDEKHPVNPINYYGSTKRIMEEIMHWYDVVYGIRYSSLRYFNAAGHSPDTDITVIEENPQNLIPVILEVALGKRKKLQIFGKNYKTPDGTCIRDYIHVSDLATAHVKSIEYLQEHNKSILLNLGTGKGFSVKQVYDIACKVTGKKIPMEFTKPRPGDPGKLFARSRRAKQILKWTPEYTSLEQIVSHAWNAFTRKFS